MDHRLIARGMVAVTAFAVLGKAAGAAKEMAVAWRYGIGAEVDAYLMVLSFVGWPGGVWLSVLSVLLIPIAAKMRRGGEREFEQFRAEMLGVTIALGAALIVLGAVTLPPLLRSRWLGLPAHTVELALQLAPGLLWLVPLSLLVGLYATWVMSAGSHANTLLEGVPAIGILFAVLLAGGVGSLAWGTVGGAVVQLAGLVAVGWVGRSNWLPSFRQASPQWASVWPSFGVIFLGQATMGLTTLIDPVFAARLGEGAISSLGYANRVLAMGLGVAGVVVTRATLPVFSSVRAAGADPVHEVAFRWVKVTLVIGGLGVAAGWFLAPVTVRLLFERGTFTAADTHTVARLLRLGLLQLPFYMSGLVLASLHSSCGRYRVLLASGILGLSVKAVASYLLVPIFNVDGLMLAFTLVYGANAVLLARLVPR